VSEVHPCHAPDQRQKTSRSARHPLVPDLIDMGRKTGGMFGFRQEHEPGAGVHGAQKRKAGFGLGMWLKQDDKNGSCHALQVIRHERA